MSKLFNPYAVAVPVEVEETVDGKVVKDTINVQPRATIKLKNYTVAATTLANWPKLVIIEDKPLATAPATAEAPKKAKLTKE